MGDLGLVMLGRQGALDEARDLPFVLDDEDAQPRLLLCVE
jgi:hypothetical protein